MNTDTDTFFILTMDGA